MKMSRRTAIITSAICLLAVGAGLTAQRALADGSTEYCANCTLPSSGVPAASSVFKDFYYNEAATEAYVNIQIYNYYSGTVSCGYHGEDIDEIWTGYPTITMPNSYSCIPTTTFADARCHLLNGTGPTTGICYAEYQTTG